MNENISQTRQDVLRARVRETMGADVTEPPAVAPRQPRASCVVRQSHGSCI